MQDPFAPLELVATHPSYRDPAIDMSEPGEGSGDDAPTAAQRIERYRETCDRKHLRFREGAEPIIFVCKPLTASFVLKVLRGASPAQAALNALIASCHEVRLPGGKTKTPPKFERELVFGMRVPSDEDAWIGVLAGLVGTDNLEDLGAIIHRRAKLPEVLRAPFVSPPSST